MLSRDRLFAVLVAGLLVTAPWFNARADQPTAPGPVAHHHKAHKKQEKQEPLVLPPLPAGPLQQIPMDQLPPTAPQVTYKNGLLSIAAQNSTLAEILHEVAKLTGASIDVPSSGASGRVVAQLGPGAPRDVLALLLNGTAFNYVMLGSASNPNAVVTIVLTAKPSSGEAKTATNTSQPPLQTSMSPPNPNSSPVPARMPNGLFSPGAGVPVAGTPVGQPATTAEADENADESGEDKEDESDQQQPEQPGQVVVPQPNSSDEGGAGPNQPNAGPKTPEQILEMLRRGQPQAPPGVPTQPPPQ